MNKSVTIIVVLLAIAHIGISQDTELTKLRHNLVAAKDDTSRVLVMSDICVYYRTIKLDSSLIYGYKALALARKIKFSRGEFNALESLIITQGYIGNNSEELQLILQADKIAEKNNSGYEKATLLLNRGAVYENSKNYIKALSMFRQAKKAFDSINDLIFSQFAQLAIGKMYLEMHQPDSALYHCETAYKNAVRIKDNWVPKYILPQLGRVQDELGNEDIALSYYRQTLSQLSYDAEEICACYLSIAQLYEKTGKFDSAVFYGGKSLALASERSFYKNIINASLFLSGIYEKKDFQQALLYSKNAILFKDSLHKIVESSTLESFTDFNEQERQHEIEEAKSGYQIRLRTYTFLGITFTLLVIAVFLFRSSRLKQRAKQNIEKAYHQLRSTQGQLIQSEKMASLGELTAGIAHEIQNPLNFVNNFSEVNKELIEEVKSQKSKLKSEELDELLDDIFQNNEKINHHGKRADAIVKGMLQHSRKDTGTKEPTDINSLCDEYLRLAYHGLRAKDKTFNAALETEYDKSLSADEAGVGNVDIIPQDIGRVILNLITNAFYAVNEKATLRQVQDDSYEPTVWVSTKRKKDAVVISVKDNGNGIPQTIIDKIFQPFFTTKPTGQGTGLGLSLAYDIVKVHGGELIVETKEGEGSEFIIELPIV